MSKWNFLKLNLSATVLLNGTEISQKEEVYTIFEEIFDIPAIFDKDGLIQNEHPDFFQISKSMYGKNNIPVDTIRYFLKNEIYRPFSNRKKLFLIWNSEDLEVEAQNTLLKTLEEHKSSNIFVLTTKNKSELLPTIISRCQVFDLVHTSNNAVHSKLESYTDKNFLQKEINRITKISNSTKKWEEGGNLLDILIANVKNDATSDEKYQKIEFLLFCKQCVSSYVNLKLVLWNAMNVALQEQL
ncbi:hypothetical protein IPJ91_00805 [bacterium]|nr:MAG: hypothetical protein IPJ91_00805 [bacterium]